MAEPGYYAVMLDSGIRVQIAAQVRSGIAEFQFPADTKPHILFFDLNHNDSPRVYNTEIHIHGREVTGSVTSGNNCSFGRNRYRLYSPSRSTRTETKLHGSVKTNGLDSDARSSTASYLSFPAQSSIGIPVDEASEAVAMVRVVLGEMTRVVALSCSSTKANFDVLSMAKR